MIMINTKLGDHMRFIFTMFAINLSLKYLKFVPHKHEPKVMVVTVNAQITQVKQSLP